MKRFALLLLLLPIFLHAQNFEKNLREHVFYLASDKLEGRGTGSKGEKLAAKYIAKQFQNYGLLPAGTKGYIQSFPFSVKSKDGTITQQGVARNVLGFINNNAEHTVVIGAHYDHLGFGAENSLHRGEKAIHNGADDNASGTAVLIELARILKSGNYKNNNYLLIAFSGEELGLFGSAHFIKSDLASKYAFNYMINMDMVGRLDEENKTIIINGFGTSPLWKDAIDTGKVNGLRIKTTESGIGPSDHTSFYLHDIPAIHFFSGTHSDYHKPSDDAEKLNYPGMEKVGEYIYHLIGKLDTKGKLPFSKTKEPEHSGKSSGFKVTLGVVPDYAWDGEGLKIDGVTEGKPAAKAGLQGGDILLRIGTEQIKDIYAYMAALGKFSKGQSVEIEFKRNGELKTSIVEF